MIDAPGLQVFASTTPSILTAGQLSATVTLSLNSPTAKNIIVKIPVGNGAADLIAAGTAGTIHPQLRGATGWTVQPTWTQNSPTYICDLTGKSPEPLVLILPSVTVSDKSGDARIIVSDGGESTSCTIVKYTKVFTLENFVAQPTSTKTLIPVNLSWRAKDAKSLHLAYKGTSDNLSPASTGKQVSVYESTTFRLEAVDQDDHRAHLTTHVQVTDPSLLIRDLKTRYLFRPSFHDPRPQLKTQDVGDPVSIKADKDRYFSIALMRASQNASKAGKVTLKNDEGESSFICMAQDLPWNDQIVQHQKQEFFWPYMRWVSLFAPAGTELIITNEGSGSAFTARVEVK